MIYIWTGDDVIDAIQFQTTNGRLSERYGGPGGSAYVVRGSDGKRERALMGFKGRSGGEVDALQVRLPLSGCGSCSVLTKCSQYGPRPVNLGPIMSR